MSRRRNTHLVELAAREQLGWWWPMSKRAAHLASSFAHLSRVFGPPATGPNWPPTIAASLSDWELVCKRKCNSQSLTVSASLPANRAQLASLGQKSVSRRPARLAGRHLASGRDKLASWKQI